MVKSMKKFLLLIISVLLLVVVFDGGLIQASEVTDIGSAKYYVDEVIQENLLPNGVKQATHKAFTSAAADEVTSMGLNITEPFVANKYYQQQVNVLEVPSSTDVRITPWAYISQGQWNLATVRRIAADYEAKNPGNRVIAAINADFFDINANRMFPRTPSGAHASMGEFYKTLTGNAVGFTNDGSTETLIGNEKLVRSSHMTLSVYDDNGIIIKEFQIDKINSEPTENQISIYYAKWAREEGWASQRIKPINVEDAFIVDNGDYAIPSSHQDKSGTGSTTEDFYGRGKVSSIGNAELSTGDFAIKSNNPEVVEALSIGTKIRAQYHFVGAHEGIGDIVGVGNTILYDGQKTGSDTNRHPRTMIGVKEDGTIVMTVVDGRQPEKLMYGASQAEMAAILKHYGAIEGYNLDGGGSSTMLILKDGDFEVTNSPSDNTERSDSNAILITVKVPDIEHEVVDITSSSFALETKVNEDNPLYDEIYVKFQDEYHLIENNKIEFTDLLPNYQYIYELYIKKEDKFVSLVIIDKASTAKRTPRIDGVSITVSNNESVFDIVYYDPDNAITRKEVRLADETKFITASQAVFVDFVGDLYNDLELYIRYDVYDGNGTVDFIPENLHIKYGALVHLHITSYRTAQAIKGIYSGSN